MIPKVLHFIWVGDESILGIRSASVTHERAWKTVGLRRLTDSSRRYRYHGLGPLPSHYFIPEHFTGLAYDGAGPVYALARRQRADAPEPRGRLQETEIVHPDHNCWYTPYTLSNVSRKYPPWQVEGMWFFDSISLLALLSNPSRADAGARQA